MAKWEYCRVHYDVQGEKAWVTFLDFGGNVAREITPDEAMPRDYTLSATLRELARLGREGWEMLAADSWAYETGDLVQEWYLKRPLEQ